VVGVNRFQEADAVEVPVLEIDPALEQGQSKRLEQWKSERNAETARSALDEVEAVARSDSNLLPAMKEALASGATLGEVSDRLRNVFGSHRPG
jgi:methylmalonyl-CoA mutase N-terminal domain/subunit